MCHSQTQQESEDNAITCSSGQACKGTAIEEGVWLVLVTVQNVAILNIANMYAEAADKVGHRYYTHAHTHSQTNTPIVQLVLCFDYIFHFLIIFSLSVSLPSS